MLIGVLIIVVGAFVVATKRVPLAIILQVIFLAAMLGIFIWLQ